MPAYTDEHLAARGPATSTGNRGIAALASFLAAPSAGTPSLAQPMTVDGSELPLTAGKRTSLLGVTMSPDAGPGYDAQRARCEVAAS